MELFFNSDAQPKQDEIEFDKFESNHILKSKRKKVGDEIQFTNGKGDLFSGTLKSIKPKVICNYNWIRKFPVADKQLTLAVGFIRPNRLDFLIEKITEIGINKIILFSSQNGNYFTDNTERWKKITRQAIKQSVRYHLPEIETINSFEKLLEISKEYDGKYITEQKSETTISDIDIRNKNSTIYIIGPEGGLTADEINHAKSKGFNEVNLGDYRLRTETAALVFGALLSTNIN
jgi:16S rRNA (uracil1498-N3)-methyltransferase